MTEPIQIISASTLVKALEKDGLTRWKENMTAEGVVANIDAINRMIAGGTPLEHITNFIKELPYRPVPGRLGASEAGTQIHGILEAWLAGTVAPDPHPSVVPMLQWLSEWVSRNEPKLIDAEQVVFNPLTGIGGRFDQKIQLGGNGPLAGLRVLMDLKTSLDDRFKSGGLKKPYADSVALQLATYRYATHQATIDMHVEQKWSGRQYYASQEVIDTAVVPTQVDACAVLYLTPARCWLYPIDVNEQTYERAVDAANTWRWTHIDSKKILGEAIRA